MGFAPVTGSNAVSVGVPCVLFGWIDAQVGKFDLDRYTRPGRVLNSISHSGNRVSGKGVSAQTTLTPLRDSLRELVRARGTISATSLFLDCDAR